MKVDFATLHERHPRLCQIDIVGYPGEAAEIPGHDLTYLGYAGLLDLGYVGFYAVGAYGYALLSHYFGLSFWAISRATGSTLQPGG